MRVELLLVTFRRDWPYLRFWLRGAAKFVRGLDRINILVPLADLPELTRMVKEVPFEAGAVEVRCLGGEEWPDKGFNWHQAQIMRADELCPEADIIVHSDPDRVPIETYTLWDVVRDGKPLIVHGSYRWLREEVQANLDMWRDGVDRAVGFPATQECMRRMPVPHIREVYAKTRELVEAHTHMAFDDYMKAQKNDFPQSVCEFNTLGAVAWEQFHDRYHWLDQEKGEYPPDKVVNGWSQSGMRAEDLQKFKEAGLAP